MSIILRTEPEWQRTTMITRRSHRKGGGKEINKRQRRCRLYCAVYSKTTK